MKLTPQLVDVQTFYIHNSKAVHVHDLGKAENCEGGWVTYVTQNMPGLNNNALEEGFQTS